jgi:sec-independent protein translocase protein TatA
VLPGLTPVHLLVVLVVALLVFGPTRLPELARQVGAAMNVYRELRDRVHHDLNPHALVESLLEKPEPAQPDAAAPEDVTEHADTP